MKKIFDENDCRQLENGETYENKFVILSLDQFKPEYQSALYQLFHAETGSGCYPDNMGDKVFGRLYDEKYQTRSEYILGVAIEDAIIAWEKEYKMSRDVFISKAS